MPRPETTQRIPGAGRLWALVLLVCLCALPSRAIAADAAALEYKVKAGYLFNFAKFIEWPAASAPKTNSPLVIGILDGGEAFPVVKPLLDGKTVDGRVVQVKAVTADQVGSGLHILLVTRAAGKTPEEIRIALGSAATLLVGETDRFAELGGMMGFTREEDSVRLTLNLERATEAGLKVSSKLAGVAKLVKSKRGN